MRKLKTITEIRREWLRMSLEVAELIEQSHDVGYLDGEVITRLMLQAEKEVDNDTQIC
jgi:hypothetical protein